MRAASEDGGVALLNDDGLPVGPPLVLALNDALNDLGLHDGDGLGRGGSRGLRDGVLDGAVLGDGAGGSLDLSLGVVDRDGCEPSRDEGGRHDLRGREGHELRLSGRVGDSLSGSDHRHFENVRS